MSQDPEVSELLIRVREGDGDAAQALWDKYFQKLVRRAMRGLEDKFACTEALHGYEGMRGLFTKPRCRPKRRSPPSTLADVLRPTAPAPAPRKKKPKSAAEIASDDEDDMEA